MVNRYTPLGEGDHPYGRDLRADPVLCPPCEEDGHRGDCPACCGLGRVPGWMVDADYWPGAERKPVR